MELFLNTIFYSTKWLLFFDTVPIKLYVYLYILSLFINIFQSILLAVYFLNHNYYTSLTNFSIITLINIITTISFLFRIDTVYNTDFKFLHKAIEVDKKISLKPYNNIIRLKCTESIIGMLNFIFSFLKVYYTIYSNFVYNASNLYNINNLGEIKSEEDYLIVKYIFYFFFDFYYKLAYYSCFYLEVICIVYLVIKLGYVVLSFNYTIIQFRIMRCKKLKSRIDDLKDSFFHNLIEFSEKLIKNAKESTDNLPLIHYYASSFTKNNIINDEDSVNKKVN